MSYRISLGLIGVSVIALSSPAQADYRSEHCAAGRGLERSLNDLLQAAPGIFSPPGIAMSVFDQNSVVASAAAGVRSINGADPVTVDDAFVLGSNTKHLLAVSFAQLVDEGRVSYSDRIGDLLPDMRDSMTPEYRDATLEQLLNMTAGFASYNGSDPERDAELIDWLEDNAAGDLEEQRRQTSEFFLKEKPTYAPGQGQLYSNAGYIVLGTVYENLTGTSYEEGSIDSTFGVVGESAAFGVPRDLGPNNPALHFYDEASGSLVAVDDPADADVFNGRLPAIFNSAGGMISSMPAFAEVERQLLRSAMGLSQPLASNDALSGLFEPVGVFGLGAIDTSHVIGETTHFFVGGTVGGSAYTFLMPESGTGVVIGTNTGVDFLDGLVEDKAEAFRLLATFAERANKGVLIPHSEDQKTVFTAVEYLCDGVNGDASEIVKLFGELTSEQASALAERVAPDDSRIIDVLSTAPLEAVSEHLEAQMSPGGYALRGRLSNDVHDGWRPFMTGSFLRGSLSADELGLDSDYNGRVATWGIENQLSDNLRLGLAFGYGESRTHLTGRNGSVVVRSPQVAVSLAFDGGSGLFADARAVYGRQSISTARDIAVDGLHFGTADAKRKADGLLLDAVAGYSLGSSIRVAPMAGLRYTHLDIKSVEESGSVLALSIDGRSARRLDGRVGFSIAGEIDLGGFTVRPHVEGFYVRSIVDDRDDIVARFAEGGAMHFAAAPLSKNYANIHAAVDVEKGPAALQLGVSGTLGRNSGNDLRWNASASWKF